MLFGFRVDASFFIGTGHVYRCLTLANRLKESEHQVVFFCRELKGNLIEMVSHYHEVVTLPLASDLGFMKEEHCVHAKWLEATYKEEKKQTVTALSTYLSTSKHDVFDWIIADSYALEKQWHKAVRPYTHYIMQIDDLADREHDCELLLDQNFFLNGNMRYQSLIPEHGIALTGPSYALLRPEFKIARDKLITYANRFKKKRVVLFFGGVDVKNETEKALKGLLKAPENGDVFDVIVGSNNPNIESLQELIDKHGDRAKLHIQVPNMMDFFSKSYLYVGAVGATTWERCVLGLPGIVCSVADNQVQVAKDLDKANGHTYLGSNSALSPNEYRDAYLKILLSYKKLEEQAEVCAKMVDGMGCQRIYEKLMHWGIGITL